MQLQILDSDRNIVSTTELEVNTEPPKSLVAQCVNASVGGFAILGMSLDSETPTDREFKVFAADGELVAEGITGPGIH